MKKYSKGDEVRWSWGEGYGTGEIVEVHTQEVEKTLKGSIVKRNASKDNPAYLIEQEQGDQVLKSGSELQKA